MVGGICASTLWQNRLFIFKPSTAFIYRPIKRYSTERHDVEERAPSLAQEFKRVAEEKQQKAEEGEASRQTAEKAYDGTETAVHEESKDNETVKEKYKEQD